MVIAHNSVEIKEENKKAKEKQERKVLHAMNGSGVTIAVAVHYITVALSVSERGLHSSSRSR